jgi:hypothetical protein
MVSFFVLVGGGDEFVFFFVVGGRTEGGGMAGVGTLGFEGDLNADVDDEVLMVTSASNCHRLYLIRGVIFIKPTTYRLNL